jgi:hypothetical protein
MRGDAIGGFVFIWRLRWIGKDGMVYGRMRWGDIGIRKGEKLCVNGVDFATEENALWVVCSVRAKHSQIHQA